MKALRQFWTHSDESGAVAVIAAITLTTLLLMAAFVLDIAGLRADRVQSKAAADMAATAGALTYNPEASRSARAACEEAVSFVEANLPGFQNEGSSSGCDEVIPEAACTVATANTPNTAIYESGAYTVRITTPVPYGSIIDTDGTSVNLLGGQPADAAHDGTDPCERIGVRISRNREYLLARVAGFTSGETTQFAVARFRPGGEEEIFASLVILEEQGCGALKNSGNKLGQLIVGSAKAEDGTDLPGTITVDTVPDGGCSGGNNWAKRVVAVQDNGQALIRADGRIFSLALEEGFDPQRVYYPDVVSTDPATTSGLYPRPTPGTAITREPVDHRFNCMGSYPPNERWSPAWTGSVGLPIDGCTGDDTPDPFLKGLVDDLGSVDASADGWKVFPDDYVGDLAVPVAECKGAEGTISDPLVYIDCSSSGNDIFEPAGIAFEEAQYIVSQNRVELGGGEENFLTIEGDATSGAVLYLQNGRLYKTGQARMYLLDTFVYIHDGHLDFGGNNPTDSSLNHLGCSSTGQAFGVCWHAPERPTILDGDGNKIPDPTPCEALTADETPPAVCFAPLALWSNNATLHDLGGQTTFDISGSFFTPNASPFRLSGQAEQNFEDAQFFTAQLEMSGQAPVFLAPNPNTNIPIPLPGIQLMR